MVKRAFDILASGLAMLVLAPVLLPIMLGLRLTGEGEIFYGQARMGRGGKIFMIYKFATMLKNSPNMTGGDITVGNDPRILPMGGFLRKTKINELPQLLNIFLGDMSVIGPRPLTPRVASLFPQTHWAVVGNWRPGLSGVSSIVFRDEEGLLNAVEDRQAIYATVIVPYKAALEHWYTENQSLWVDVKLILLTLAVVLKKDLEIRRFLRDLPTPPSDLLALRASARG